MNAKINVQNNTLSGLAKATTMEILMSKVDLSKYFVLSSVNL